MPKLYSGYTCITIYRAKSIYILLLYSANRRGARKIRHIVDKLCLIDRKIRHRVDNLCLIDRNLKNAQLSYFISKFAEACIDPFSSFLASY